MIKHEYISALKACEIRSEPSIETEKTARNLQIEFLRHLRLQLLCNCISILINLVVSVILTIFHDFIEETLIIVYSLFLIFIIIDLWKVNNAIKKYKQYKTVQFFDAKLIDKTLKKDDFYFGLALIDSFDYRIEVTVNERNIVRNISVNGDTFNELQIGDEVAVLYFPLVKKGSNLFARKL